MYSDNKQIRDVADVAAKIMYGQQPVTEKLHPNQQQLDVHEPEKDELTADDFKKLRAKKAVKKEEVEQQDEAMSHQAATTMKHIPNPSPALKKAAKDIKPGVGGYRDRIDMLKAGGVKEEVEQVDEKFGGTQKSLNQTTHKTNDPMRRLKVTTDHPRFKDKPLNKTSQDILKNRLKSAQGTHSKPNLPEEVEQIDEVKMSDLPSRKVQGSSYGSSKPQPHPFDMTKGPKDKDLKDIESEKKKKKFSEMVNLYQEKGLKALSEMTVKEGASEDQWNAQVEVAKFKSNTKDDDTVRPVKKKTNVATPLEVATKNEEVEIVEYPLDVDAINGIQMSTIEERHMTDGEMDKRETIVKSMKKGMAGFKDRYGDRAKNVMYATANKQAMKD
jgi:hypothetical protein